MLTRNRVHKYGQGFSLIELLVVLVIMAILAAIVIPSLIASQPERNLSAAAERFATDLRYCRAKAEATGQNIYLGFIYSPYEGQVDAGLNSNGDPIDPRINSQLSSDTHFSNPANPGITRTCTEYYIVQERPRTMRVSDVRDNAGNSTQVRYNESDPLFNPSTVIPGMTVPMTYLDWLNWYDGWDTGENYANGKAMQYPEEPRYPYRRTIEGLDPKLEAINSRTQPLVAYPQYIINSASNYLANFSNADATWTIAPSGSDWSAGEIEDQQFKVFCVADENAILSWDDGLREAATGRRIFTESSDYDMLDDPVIDYVLLKRVKLPEHVYFINPWRSQWVVGWDGPTNNRKYIRKTLAFMQHLFQFKANGSVTLCDWSYAPPETGDVGRDYRPSLYHGAVVPVDNMPTIRPMWMILDECIDFSQPETYNYAGRVAGGEISVLHEAKKANLSASGRMFLLWPENGKFYVDEYTPNDSARIYDKDFVFFDVSRYASGGGALQTTTPSGGEMSVGAEEYGWAQDFLCSPGVADHMQR